MLKNIQQGLVKLHRDERGAASVETIIIVGLSVLVLFTVGQLVGVTGQTGANVTNNNTLIGKLWSLSIGKIFDFGNE
jgi:Flp pilus assembly pilin Flp